MKKDKKIKIYLALIYIVILTLFLTLFFNNYSINEITSYDFLKENRTSLIALKENNYYLSSILFVLITIIWILLLGFGSPIMIVAGFLFGKWFGSFLGIIGITFGSTILYLLANYFFKDVIEEKFGKKFSNIHEKFKKNEFLYFIIYRFVGGIPMQIQNLIPIIFNVKLKNYFFGSLIGMTPQIFIWSSFGSGIEKVIDQNTIAPSIIDLIFFPDIYIPLIGFFILLISALIIKKFFFNN